MRIIRDGQAATWTFLPVTASEEQAIATVLAMLKPEDKLAYEGRCTDKEDDRFCTIRLSAGVHREERQQVDGFLTIIHDVCVDGAGLFVCGSTEEDKKEVGFVRDTCYWGSSGLIFLGTTQVDDKLAIVTTAKRCKHCNAGMIWYYECESNTCNACAAKCEHTYVHGVVHGGGVDIGMGEFCSKCKRGKPRAEGERKKTPIEGHLAVERELGVHVIYPEGLMTPKHVVYARRVARRYVKSRQRHIEQ